VHVPNKSVHTARRTLGPIKCPGRNQDAQYQSHLAKSDDFEKVMQSTFLSKREAWTAYFSFYLVMMCYVLNTSFLSKEQLDKIQKKATQILIRQSGFNSYTTNAVKFGPPRLGAIGFRYLYTEQSLLQQCMLIKHLRTPGQPQALYLICLSWAKLLCRIGLPLLEFPDLAAPTLEDEFLQSLWTGMVHTNSSIQLHLSLVRPPARENDFYFMEGLQSLEKMTPADLFKVNYCRLFCGVYLASDVVLPSRTQVNKPLFLGQVHCSHTKPGIKFPRQKRPGASSWKQWRRAIRLLFTTPCCTELQLLTPLGAWYPLRYDSQQWKCYRVDAPLIVRSGSPSGLIQYSHPLLHRHCFQFLKSNDQPIPSLPIHSVPVDAPQQDRRYWRLPVSSGLDAIADPPPQSLLSRSWLE
jgi:hypothetical protein